MVKNEILKAYDYTVEQLINKGFNFEDLYLIGKVEKEYYSPSESYEYFYNGDFYNLSGQQLRSPNDYNQHSEGYTPFGDE